MSIIDYNKPFLCFYVGPSPMFCKEQKFGSELATEYLAAEFCKSYNVIIAADECKQDIYKNGIIYINSQRLTQWRFEIMIVSRYIAYFLEFDSLSIAKKTYVWLHDVDFHPYWSGTSLPNRAIPFVRNIDHKVTAYISLSPWHAKQIGTNYGLNPEKIWVIGNGLKQHNQPSKKIPGKFVWMSDHQRGLTHLIHHFPKIINIIPHARLEIFRELPKELAEHCSKFSYIILRGHANNFEVLQSLETAEYWFYPTEWYETYCISALEAQSTGCICIATDLAALSTTIGNRGILLKSPIYSDAYWKEALEALTKLESNPENKKYISRNAKQWAMQQTWAHKAQEWYRLFKH